MFQRFSQYFPEKAKRSIHDYSNLHKQIVQLTKQNQYLDTKVNIMQSEIKYLKNSKQKYKNRYKLMKSMKHPFQVQKTIGKETSKKRDNLQIASFEGFESKKVSKQLEKFSAGQEYIIAKIDDLLVNISNLPQINRKIMDIGKTLHQFSAKVKQNYQRGEKNPEIKKSSSLDPLNNEHQGSSGANTRKIGKSIQLSQPKWLLKQYSAFLSDQKSPFEEKRSYNSAFRQQKVEGSGKKFPSLSININ